MPIKRKCYRNHAVREPPTDRLSITYLKAVLVTSRKVANVNKHESLNIYGETRRQMCVNELMDDSVKRKKTR